MKLHAIVLAAGKGTRMKSDLLKVAHNVAGKPIATYILDALSELRLNTTCVVVGHQAEKLKEKINTKNVTYVTQEKQNGTGHAVMQTQSYLSKDVAANIIILPGDCPLIQADTLKNLMDIHNESNAVGTVLTAKMMEPGSYGRILRGKMGTVIGIKEAKDASPTELAIDEINTGIYVFKSAYLFDSLSKIQPNNAQKEYYLTDVIQILKDQGHVISAYCTEDEDQIMGINTRIDLAKINKIIYKKHNEKLMLSGVTIKDPDTTFIDSTVKIQTDTIIYPFSILRGNTSVGKHCRIGPHVYIMDGKVANESVVEPFSKITPE